MRWGGACMVAVLVCASTVGTVHADSVDEDVARMESPSYKVRVSAALQLSRTSDDRAVMALAAALRDDSQKTVRNVAALSLGKMVSPRTSDKARQVALLSLQRAARRDKSSTVRRAAKKSLVRLSNLGPAGGPRKAPLPGSVFLHIGDPADSTRRLSKGDRSEVLTAVSRTISKHAPTYGIGTEAGALPTRAELDERRVHGFFVGAQIADLTIERRGRQAEVRCRVSVRVGPWYGSDGGERIVADRSASASGSARVVGSGSRLGVQTSQRDCVVAVAEEVTARQVVPFLRKVSR